jgi:hypothetical protein
MKITIEHGGYRMVIEPEPGRFDVKTLIQEKRLEIEADLDEVPRWEVAD